MLGKRVESLSAILIFFYPFTYHNFTEDGVNYMIW